MKDSRWSTAAHVATVIVAAVTVVAVVGGLWGTAISLNTATEQLRVAEDGQNADRYAKAVEHLGQNDVYVRVAGIYALEQLIMNRTEIQPTVIELLSSFVRTSVKRECSTIPPPRKPEDGRPYPDAHIQAAFAVIARRDPRHDGRAKADLSRSDLHGVEIADARLSGATLVCTDLSDSILHRADLAEINGVGAQFSRARLVEATFVGAQLGSANFLEANLNEANLSGVDLSESKGLTTKQLSCAKIDANTKLPSDVARPSTRDPSCDVKR